MPGQHLREVFRGDGGFNSWFSAHIWHEGGLWQAVVCLGTVGLGHVLSRALCGKLGGMCGQRPALRQWVTGRLSGLFTPLFTLLLLQVALGAAQARGWPSTVLELAISFSEAWLIIQLFASILLPHGWTKAVTVVVGGVFVLEVLGIFGPVLDYMDSIALNFDEERVSFLEIIKAFLLLGVMLPLINKACAVLEAGLERVGGLNARVRVLAAKLTKAGLYAVAFVSALDLVGINLHMLTVFSGALGLGVGFGLQKVVSNLVSGVILLLDNSIKPGDVIEVGGVYGWVESMNARFASMVTRDGKAFLIPNDDLIANRVVNWSFSGPGVRLKIPVGVAYATDLKLAVELMLKAAEGKDRVLANPKPNVLLREFGDNGVLLELRVWMMHPEHGVANVSSAVMNSIWELFHAHGIEFPYPQRDVHMKDAMKVQVEYLKPGEGK